MQVTVEDLSSVKKMLHIEIPEDTISGELEKAYDELKKKVKLKGFRPGKVPRDVLVQYFKKDVHADVSSKLIQQSFVDAIKETDLKIVGTPKIDPPALKAKEPFKFSAEVEIRPEISDLNLKDLRLKKTRYAVSDAEVDAQLRLLQRNTAQYEPIPEVRPLAMADYAIIDYEGFKEGKPFESLQKTENYMLKVGAATMTRTLDESLTGMKPGESKRVAITFPEDFYNRKLAGLSVDLQVTLKEIRKEVLPDIDDEFAKKMGKYETVEALKGAIRANLTQGYEKRTEQELNEQIFQALLDQVSFEVPESLVEYELEHIVSDAERYFSYHNVQMEDAGVSRESLSEKYRDTAVKQVKRHLVLRKIIEQENLDLTDQEQDAGFAEMAASLQQPAEEIKNYYGRNEDKLEGLKQTLLEKKAIRLIMDTSKIEMVEPETPVEQKNDADKPV